MVLEPVFYDFDYETPPAEEVEYVKNRAPVAAKAKTKPYKPEWALILGSFEDYRSAVAMARRAGSKKGLVTGTVVQGKIRYLVTTRPFTLDQAEREKGHIAALQIENVKMISVCPNWMRSDTCISLDRSFTSQQATLP